MPRIKRAVSRTSSVDSSLSSARSIDEPSESNGQPEKPTKRQSAKTKPPITKGKTESKVTIREKVEPDPRSRRKAPPAQTREASVTVKTELVSPKRKAVKAQSTRETQVNGSSNRTAETTVDEATEAQLQVATPKRRTRKTKVEAASVEEATQSPKKSRKRAKTETELSVSTKEGEEDNAIEPPKKIQRRRKTKEEKEAEAMPLAARTSVLRMFIGAHVSSAKGVQNAVTNCVHIGGNAFALFLKSQRKWENPPLQDEHKSQFLGNCKTYGYDASKHILPHGSYLVNLAQEDPTKAKQAYDAFLDDLHRCEALGIKLYNFHPGWTGPFPRASAITRIASALNRAHASTKTVKPILENMAGSGNVIGSSFEDLRDIIAAVDDKSRIGVCLDTCHAFAAGYDLRTAEAFRETLRKFDEVVGMKYLSALHLNDSKAPFGSHRDLHANVGVGFLGLRAFHAVVNEGRLEGLPMVLETPIERKDGEGKMVEDKGVWAREIKLLESLVGMDVEGEEFGRLEGELEVQGREERMKFRDAYEKKLGKEKEKEKKKGGDKGGRRGRKKKPLDEDDDDDAEEESGSR